MKSIHRDYSGKNNPMYKEKIKWICPECQIVKYFKPGEAKRRKYCSYECFGNSRKNKKLSEQHKLDISKNHWSKGPKAKIIAKKLSNSLKGHLPWSKGKHYKIKDTSKMKKTKNFLGHTHTKEAKEKNRQAHLGKKQTEATKHKRANSRKLFFKNGGVGGMKDKHHTDVSKKKIKKYQLEHPNKKFSNTSIEQKIAAELNIRKINFQQNIGILNIANVDFYLPKHNIIIECDGDYWHNRPGSQENDKRKTKLLEQNGYNIYRFWEHDINKSSEKCIDRIKF